MGSSEWLVWVFLVMYQQVGDVSENRSDAGQTAVSKVTTAECLSEMP